MQPHSLNDLVNQIESVLGRKMLVKYEPARKFDVPHLLLDTSLAQAALNWKPTVSLDEGILLTAEWIKNWIIQ
jgi:UDP-glucose 4-epimerase